MASAAPENFVGRFFGRVFNTDIELESEDFNRRFTVTCDDRKFAFDVLHPRMMELLLRHPGLAWRFCDDSLLVFADGRFDPAAVEPRITVMGSILDLVPEFVWLQLRGGDR